MCFTIVCSVLEYTKTSEMGCIGRWKVNTICNYEGGGWSSSLISTKKPEDSEERLILSFYPNGYYTVERQDLKTSKSDIIERGYYYEYKDGGKLYMVSSFGENIEYKYSNFFGMTITTPKVNNHYCEVSLSMIERIDNVAISPMDHKTQNVLSKVRSHSYSQDEKNFLRGEWKSTVKRSYLNSNMKLHTISQKAGVTTTDLLSIITTKANEFGVYVSEAIDAVFEKITNGAYKYATTINEQDDGSMSFVFSGDPNYSNQPCSFQDTNGAGSGKYSFDRLDGVMTIKLEGGDTKEYMITQLTDTKLAMVYTDKDSGVLYEIVFEKIRPQAAIKNLSVNGTSMSATVKLYNTTKAYWYMRPRPKFSHKLSRSEVMEIDMDLTNEKIQYENLEPNTIYELYVVPCRDSEVGKMVYKKFHTSSAPLPPPPAPQPDTEPHVEIDTIKCDIDVIAELIKSIIPSPSEEYQIEPRKFGDELENIEDIKKQFIEDGDPADELIMAGPLLEMACAWRGKDLDEKVGDELSYDEQTPQNLYGYLQGGWKAVASIIPEVDSLLNVAPMKLDFLENHYTHSYASPDGNISYWHVGNFDADDGMLSYAANPGALKYKLDMPEANLHKEYNGQYPSSPGVFKCNRVFVDRINDSCMSLTYLKCIPVEDEDEFEYVYAFIPVLYVRDVPEIKQPCDDIISSNYFWQLVSMEAVSEVGPSHLFYLTYPEYANDPTIVPNSYMSWNLRVSPPNYHYDTNGELVRTEVVHTKMYSDQDPVIVTTGNDLSHYVTIWFSPEDESCVVQHGLTVYDATYDVDKDGGRLLYINNAGETVRFDVVSVNEDDMYLKAYTKSYYVVKKCEEYDKTRDHALKYTEVLLHFVKQRISNFD